MATPPRAPDDATPRDDARAPTPDATSADPSSDDLVGPAEAPSLRCDRRGAAVPYFGAPSTRTVRVNDAARTAIREANARQFIALPRADDPALLELRAVIERGWQTHEAMGSGDHCAWPELFDAGAAFVRAQLRAELQASDDADLEVLPGTGWFGDGADEADEAASSKAIDWVVRRPENFVVSSKIHFATRLHRDPDSWTNPRTPQRPRAGWTDLAMPDRETYAYRFVNVWIARSALDPTGQVWQSPLVVCLPREGGAREWAFEKRTLAMDEGEAEKEYNVKGVDPLDPKTWIPGVNRLFRPLWNGGSAEQAGERGEYGGVGAGEESDEEARGDGGEGFEFPELLPDDRHVFVTAPAMVFDSFDLWHGAATWDEPDEAKKTLRQVDTKGRQPFHRARCSIEMRFRVRTRIERGDRGGPFNAAVNSGKFRDDGLRDSEARYDLEKGVAVRE